MVAQPQVTARVFKSVDDGLAVARSATVAGEPRILQGNRPLAHAGGIRRGFGVIFDAQALAIMLGYGEISILYLALKENPVP